GVHPLPGLLDAFRRGFREPEPGEPRTSGREGVLEQAVLRRCEGVDGRGGGAAPEGAGATADPAVEFSRDVEAVAHVLGVVVDQSAEGVPDRPPRLGSADISYR